MENLSQKGGLINCRYSPQAEMSGGYIFSIENFASPIVEDYIKSKEEKRNEEIKKIIILDFMGIRY